MSHNSVAVNRLRERVAPTSKSTIVACGHLMPSTNHIKFKHHHVSVDSAHPGLEATHLVLVVAVVRPPREENLGKMALRSVLVAYSGMCDVQEAKDMSRMTLLRNHGCAPIARVDSFQQGLISQGESCLGRVTAD